jgi:hypothetical protein
MIANLLLQLSIFRIGIELSVLSIPNISILLGLIISITLRSELSCKTILGISHTFFPNFVYIYMSFTFY